MTPPPSPDAPAASAPTDPTPGEVVVIGAGPAGLTAAYVLGRRGVTVHRARGRRRGRRHQPHRRARRLALRHRRPPLLHQGARRSRSCGTRSSARRTSSCAPRMSRIYYDGKYFDYPLKAFNALRNLGLIEAVLCVGSYALGPRAAAEGPGQLRGLGRRPLRLAPLPDLLQDLHREGLGHAGRARCRPTGPPSGSRTCRSFKAVINAAPAQAEPEGDHQPHRGVPVPQVRPRDDVGALHREGARRRAPRSHMETTVDADPPRRRPGDAVTPRPAASDRLPVRPRHLARCRSPQLLQAMDPPVPARGARRGRRPALPRLPHRRARGARGGRVPRQLDLHPRPRRCRSAASRTSARGRRTW